ncbi:helix-turn-helix domain-containing protein [Paenibacillus sp. PL91]|uniref:helix-turn-helix domain-containing protein n=1 Tax=Paenibacillus sp. PL91 TaxID=2729538 RepID=UPI00145CE836|nr:AraC family transcriptional regulator [Paenibacillus sp. PL91]MBC9200822.1 helix-turn-helix transcriptional regulator [Paenibacillus sp. PL91]
MDHYKTPERLLSKNFLTLSSPFRIYKHVIDHHIQTHWHEFFEIGFIVSGSGTHILNGEPFPLKRGMAFLLTTADFHEIIPDEGETVHLYDFIFEDSFIRPALTEMLFEQASHYAHTFEGAIVDTIEAEFDRIWGETQLWQPGSDLIVQGSFERILIELFRQTGQKQRAAETATVHAVHPSIRKSVIYIQHHFREPITLQKVSEHVGLSANYFSECFRKQTGTSFQVHLQEKRLQFAKALLVSTALPITEICYASGFNTIPNFERFFKRKFGQAPRDYRKSNK